MMDSLLYCGDLPDPCDESGCASSALDELFNPAPAHVQGHVLLLVNGTVMI